MKSSRRGRVIILSSLFLGTAISHPLQASVVPHDEAMTQQGVDFKIDDASHASSFGKETRENAKLIRSAIVDAPDDDHGSKQAWTNNPGDGRTDEYKWENAQSHLDDDKWDEHPNGVPGPVGNPCKSQFCGDTPPPAVPVPAAVWLFGSGLLGLFGLARRRSH